MLCPVNAYGCMWAIIQMFRRTILLQTFFQRVEQLDSNQRNYFDHNEAALTRLANAPHVYETSPW